MHVTTLYTSTKYTEVLKGACLDKVVSNCVFHNETTPVSILDYQHNDTMHITKTSRKRTLYMNVFPSFSQLMRAGRLRLFDKFWKVAGLREQGLHVKHQENTTTHKSPCKKIHAGSTTMILNVLRILYHNATTQDELCTWRHYSHDG